MLRTCIKFTVTAFPTYKSFVISKLATKMSHVFLTVPEQGCEIRWGYLTDN